AVCYARQQQVDKALQRVRQVIELNAKGDFDYTLEIEARYYPELPDLLARAADMRQSGREEVQALQPASPSPAAATTSEGAPESRLPNVFKLRILSFGEPKVMVDGVPVTRWHMSRSLELLFLLLESARPL